MAQYLHQQKEEISAGIALGRRGARFYLLICFLLLTSSLRAQQNPYQLPLVNTFSGYRESVKADSNNRLVDLAKAIPGLALDIRYATSNNFVGQPVYQQAKAFARLPVARALRLVQQELAGKGLALKIFDGHRPYAVTLAFYDAASDKRFVADPKKGSRHNRGCAIDLTLIDKATGKELPMPTGYDSFSPLASPSYPDLPEAVKKNRDLLIEVMTRHDFTVIENEWWHFDFNGWNRFSLMDIPFTQLSR